MSFSNRLKEEVAKLDLEEGVLVELYAIFKINGSLILRNNELSISLITESNPLTRRIYQGFKRLYDYRPLVHMADNDRRFRRRSYQLLIEPGPTQRFFQDTHQAYDLFQIRSTIPRELVADLGRQKALVRGAFLAGGYMADPDKRYHLEISAEDQEILAYIKEILQPFGILGKVAARKNRFVFYIKEAESIADFLTYIGSVQGLLAFEDVRVMKEIKNNVNRRQNAELANMDRTAQASHRQRDAILKIKERGGLDQLEAGLREIAQLRLDHPELALKDLGDLCQPQLSKSGVSYRLRRLVKMAEELD